MSEFVVDQERKVISTSCLHAGQQYCGGRRRDGIEKTVKQLLAPDCPVD